VKPLHARLILAGLVAVLLPLAGTTAATSFAAARPATTTVPAHPYSNPVYWPLATSVNMDCYSGNPGCTNPKYHTTWIMDVVSAASTKAHPAVMGSEPVFAMGAGQVHWGVTSDQGCGSGKTGRGNFLWIDHGDGVASWYGHLAWPFKVKNGAWVTAHTRIGSMGDSGYSGCTQNSWLHYIDIVVMHGNSNGKENGKYIEFTHLYACVNNAQQNWPSQLPDNPGGANAWNTWNDVPSTKYTGNPNNIEAADLSRSCIPTTPNTPKRPPTVKLKGLSTSAVRASWSAPTSGARPTGVYVKLRVWVPAGHFWLDTHLKTLSPSATSTKFTGLKAHHEYRVYVNYVNHVGAGASNHATAKTS
jgi:hypothetical protein